MTADAIVDRVLALLPGASRFAGDAHGEAVVVLDRDALPAAFTVLRDDAALRFDMLIDVTAVDYLGRTPRFEVVYQLYSVAQNHRLRLKVPVPDEETVVPSATGTWRSANWGERETFDMFGLRFAGHPDLRRILMYEEFEGHPLRKDYPLLRRQPLVPERDPIARPWFPRQDGS